MRFGKKFEDYQNINHKTVFAWLPIRLNGEVRWLETVTMEGYYYIGWISGSVVFMRQGFKD